MSATTGQGFTGNVLAALASLFIPGVGHLIQGRVLGAIFWFVTACVAGAITWIITLGTLPFGWAIAAICSCIGAATYKRP
ncbi:MAG: hypothetical protein ACREO3_02855 [Arenimonas sp.]